jgi:hypothetical protein
MEDLFPLKSCLIKVGYLLVQATNALLTVKLLIKNLRVIFFLTDFFSFTLKLLIQAEKDSLSLFLVKCLNQAIFYAKKETSHFVLE